MTRKDHSLVSVTAAVTGTKVTGKIRRAGDRYEVLIDERKLGATGNLKACLRTLGLFLRAGLPPVEEGDWQLDVQCSGSQRFGISMEMSVGNVGPMTWVGSEENPCVERILNAMPLHNLSDGIEAALAAIANCCIAAGDLGVDPEDLTDGGLPVGTKTSDS